MPTGCHACAWELRGGSPLCSAGPNARAVAQVAGGAGRPVRAYSIETSPPPPRDRDASAVLHWELSETQQCAGSSQSTAVSVESGAAMSRFGDRLWGT